MTIHIPVLPTEVFEGMNLKQGDTCVDGTLGGGGHSREILDRIGPTGHLIGLDRDPLAVEDTETRISDENATLIASNYADLPEILQELEFQVSIRLCWTLAYRAISWPLVIVGLVSTATARSIYVLT